MGRSKRQNERSADDQRDYEETWNQKKSQIETWMRCYRANEIHRFDQPIGKQYSYGHGLNSQVKMKRKIDKMHI